MRRVLLLCSISVVACAEAERDPIGVTSTRDGGVERDGGIVPQFRLTAPIDVTFDVDPSGPDTQIHAAVAMSDRAAWVAYNRPTDDGTTFFDVFAVSFDGAGAPRSEPIRLNDVRELNDTDPAIAASGDRILVAWHRDTRATTNNLDVIYRVLDADGVPVGGEHVLEVTRNGASVFDNIWMPQVIAAPGGGFRLAAVWGNDAGTAFNVFTTTIDRDGVAEVVGKAIFETDTIHQQGATVAYGGDGDLRIAWQEDDDHSRTYHTTLKADGTVAPTPPPTAFGDTASGAPNLAATAGGAVWLVTHVQRRGGADILLKSADEHDATASPVWFGEANEVDQIPGLAFGPTGGAVLWYRRIAGFQNRLFIAPVADPTSAMEIPTDVAAAPYGAAIAHVTDDTYFVAWADGANPDYRVRARFIAVR